MFIYLFSYFIGTPWIFSYRSVSFIKIYMCIFLATLFVVGEKWCNKISLWRWATFGRGFEEDISLWSSMALPFFNRGNSIFLVPKSKMVQHLHYISIMKSLKEIKPNWVLILWLVLLDWLCLNFFWKWLLNEACVYIEHQKFLLEKFSFYFDFGFNSWRI